MAISLLGIILSILGIVWLYSSMKFMKTALRVMGTIDEVYKERRSETDEDGNTSTYDSYTPSIKYIVNSVEYKFRAEVSSRNKRKYKVGNQMEILYSQEDPQKAKVKSTINNWLAPTGLTILGIMLVVGGLIQ